MIYALVGMDSGIKAELEQQYKVLEQTRPPMGLSSVSFGGKSLIVLQSEILGGVHSILVTEGRMATRLRRLLDDNLTLLEKHLPELEVDIAAYFTEIFKLAKKARTCCLTEL